MNESLALTELSAYLKNQGHSIELFVEDEEKNMEESIRRYQPDVFCVPGDLCGHHRFHRMTARLKRHFQIPIITGGTYPTFYTEEAFADENVDYLVVGEAELPFTEFLRRLEAGEDLSDIPGLWGRRDGEVFKNKMGLSIKNLDDIPPADREIYYKYGFIRDFDLKRFCTGRGCHNTCSYCFNTRLRDMFDKSIPYVRRKSVGRVMEEINFIRDRYPLKSIHFSDDIFITNKAWMREFSEEFTKNRSVRYSCNTMVDHLDDEIIDMLAESGCRAIALGVESGHEKTRREILGKKFTNTEAISKAQRLRKKGVKVYTFNMFALPGETLDEAFETVKLNFDMGAYHGRANMTIALPQTELALKAYQRGEITEEQAKIIKAMPDFSDTKAFMTFSIKKEFMNLMSLFPLIITFPGLFPLFKKLVLGKYRPFYQLFNRIALFKEKQFLEVGWISGMRYFFHTGSPYKRSKNFTTLI